MAANALPENQIHVLKACSEGLYQMPVIKVNPGLIVLSNTPRSTRSTVRDTKLLAAPWQVRTTAQMILNTRQNCRSRGDGLAEERALTL